LTDAQQMKLHLTLKIERDREQAWLALPDCLLQRLQLGPDGMLELKETAEGFVLAAVHDGAFARGLEIARSTIAAYRNALVELSR
jgi:hypothetical protein